MTFCKHTIYFIGGRREHLCDTCMIDEQVCDKKGAYRLWGGLKVKGWKVSGCSEYTGEEGECNIPTG